MQVSPTLFLQILSQQRRQKGLITYLNDKENLSL